ncbi:MAG: cyanophycinase [Ignavibacteria bacterium]|nr:cyanophycinase [Ignavibacteria bacterium]
MAKSSQSFGGPILIIGGAEDKFNERHIIRKFISLSGDKKANILIIPVASDFAEIAAKLYTTIFSSLGVKKITVLEAASRQDIMDLNADKMLDNLTGVFITGGDQMRLSSILGGTDFIKKLAARVKKGLVLAGSSAGAACMSSEMIVRGDGQSPNQNAVRISPGLSILKDIIIDQHFTQRSRLNRIITAVCYNPKNLGIGIDEDTAILINKNGILEVLGKGTVTIVDGSNVNYINIAEVKENEPFSVFGLQLHILSSTIRYDIINRKPLEMVGDYMQV